MRDNPIEKWNSHGYHMENVKIKKSTDNKLIFKGKIISGLLC